MRSSEEVELIREILHNERAAEETYSKLLAHIDENAPGMELVESFLLDHERAGEFLAKLLDENQSHETEPEIAMWRDLSFIADSTTNPLQDSMAIKALQTGEERCKLDYQNAAESDVLSGDTSRWLRAELIPATENRLSELSKLLKSLRAA